MIGAAVFVPSRQDGPPGQPRLRALQRQQLEQRAVVVMRHAPLAVVIGEHRRIAALRPGTACRHFAGFTFDQPQVLADRRHIGEAGARRPDVLLDMQRNDRHIVERQLLRLLQDLFARRIVRGAERLVDQLVELRIGIAPAVGRAPALGRIERRVLRNQRIGRLGRAGAPAEQERRERLLVGLADVACSMAADRPRSARRCASTSGRSPG